MRKILEIKDKEIMHDLCLLEMKIQDVMKLRNHLRQAKNLGYDAMVALAERSRGQNSLDLDVDIAIPELKRIRRCRKGKNFANDKNSHKDYFNA